MITSQGRSTPPEMIPVEVKRSMGDLMMVVEGSWRTSRSVGE
jgi:hypothetical protein